MLRDAREQVLDGVPRLRIDCKLGDLYVSWWTILYTAEGVKRHRFSCTCEIQTQF